MQIRLRTAIRVILRLVLLTALMIGVAFGGLEIYRPYVLSTNEGAYIDKLERLRSIEGKKAVFVGGSATHFGVQAELFQNQTGIAAVNMGVSAGKPIRLYLESIRPYMNEGDLLFVSPEYGYYDETYFYVNESGFSMVYYCDRDTAMRLSTTERCEILPQFLTTGWKSWGYALNDWLRGLAVSRSSAYRRELTNLYGDMVKLGDEYRTADTLSMAALAIGAVNDEMIADLTNDVDRYMTMGVEVYLMFAPLPDEVYNASRRSIEKIQEQLAETSVNMLFTPDKVHYPLSHFLDTVYHLTWDGAREYTEFIITQYIKMQFLKEHPCS